MGVRRLAVMAMLACSGIAVLALVAAIGPSRASAQIRTYTPPKTAPPGADWTKRIEEILPPGVESRAQATARAMKASSPDAIRAALDAIEAEGADECLLVPATLEIAEVERAAELIARR